jgi:peptidoglycan/LPS O-acetylase OafA/YrhL
MEKSTHLKYRPDIDGLRAYAVLAVVGYHLSPNWVKGGFIGVDVFFVISGYLISTIIFKKLATDSFSILEFYSRRVKRIFPALIIVMITCMVIGWFIYLPYEFSQLNKHIAAGASFLSNLILWNESGYFDTESSAKPLLHLWSLGIEEQFYIFWPCFLWFAWKNKLNIFRLTIIITILSFIYSFSITNSDPSTAFYSPFSRIWELLIGSILSYLELYRKNNLERLMFKIRNMSSIIGITIIGVATLFLTSATTNFPVFWALVPTIGAVLIITSGPKAWLNRYILSNKVLVWIGLISFPLYLWHWPLIVFTKHITDGNLSYTHMLLIFTSSIILSWLTKEYIETPIRENKKRLTLTKPTLIIMCLVLASSVALMKIKGLSRFGSETVLLLSKIKTKDNDIRMKDLYGKKHCFKYKRNQTVEMFLQNECVDVHFPNKPIVFLLGDSHSASLSLGLIPFFKNFDVNFLQVSTGWCEPTNNLYNNSICDDIFKMALERISLLKPELLILNLSWMTARKPTYFKPGVDYIEYVINYIKDLKSRGVKKIFVIGQIPTWEKSLPDVLLKYFVKKNLPIPSKTFEGLDKDSLNMDKEMRNIAYPKGVTYFSVTDILCDHNGCLTKIGDKLETDLVAWDYGHLTKKASIFLTKRLFSKEALFESLKFKIIDHELSK